MSSAQRREASSAISGSAPRPKRVEASVCSFKERVARRMAMGSNQAHSIKTFLVEKEISVSAPPMMPPMPTMREPSPSQMTQVPGSSWTLEAVESFYFFTLRVGSGGGAGIGAAHDDGMVAQFVVVESVQRVAKLEHDVVGNVDDVVDAGYAAGFEAILEPRGRRLNFYAANDAGGETAAQLRRADFHFYGVSSFC